MHKQTLIHTAALFALAIVGIPAAFAQGTLQQRPATLEQPPAAIQPAPGTLQQPRGTLLHPEPGPLMGRVAPCLIDSLHLQFTTAGDDLRGGNNNLNVEVHYANGDMETATNVNQGQEWPNYSVKAVTIPLKHPVPPNQIKQIRLVHSAQGGYTTPTPGQVALAGSPVAGPVIATVDGLEGIRSEDNWNMAQFQALGLAQGMNVPIASFGAHKFTGSDPALTINANAPAGCPARNHVVRIIFEFWTADDDLRGGSDNLNVTILFTNGGDQNTLNVNRSQNWPNGSRNRVEIVLNRAVTMNEIRAINLADTFGTGFGHDNWNMASMEAVAVLADGTSHKIAMSGFHKFSGDPSGENARQITIPAQPMN